MVDTSKNLRQLFAVDRQRLHQGPLVSSPHHVLHNVLHKWPALKPNVCFQVLKLLGSFARVANIGRPAKISAIDRIVGRGAPQNCAEI